MKDTPYKSFPAFKVSQNLSDFVVAVIPARVLLDTCFSHRLKAVEQPDGRYNLEGSQRAISTTRLKEIGNYVSSPEAAFPNSIILAANFRENSGDFEDDVSKQWEFQPSGEVEGLLTIPTNEKLAAIIDGQHRLFGFNFASPDCLDMPLVCAIYFDLPKSYQAYLFATINAKQKPVDKSQTYELFGYSLDDEEPESWTPDKLAVFLARKLNSESDSPFFRHILIPAENEIVKTASQARKSGSWMISLATIVDGIVKLVTRNAKQDSNKMLGDEESPKRKRANLEVLPADDRAPLRAYFCATNDTVTYKIVKNFFNAVDNMLWRSEEVGYIVKTVGIQALFEILRKIAADSLIAKDITIEYFESRLAGAESIDFSDNFFQASGTGRTRIRKSIEFAIGLTPMSELDEMENKRDYLSILNKSE